MMNRILNITLLLSILSIFTIVANGWAQQEDIDLNKPKHFIFLIHGIGGDKTHFGHMPKALFNILSKKDSNTEYTILNVEYDTGNNEKTPFEFAKDIDVEIKRITTSENFKKEDQISLIMHSQGGLIGSIWMFQSLMSTPGFSTPETIEHLDSFITIGSPFWGAKTAQWGNDIKRLTDRLDIEIPMPFGKRELEEMSFGSDMIFDFRMALIDPQYKTLIEYLRNNVRFLNIVGVADLLNPLGIFVSGAGKYEDDGAVPLSSARFNFLYSQSIDDVYVDGDRVRLDNVNEINIAPYVVVNAMHRSPLPEMDNFAGVAQIPKKCIEDEDCGHPTFPYLWNQILGNPIQQLDNTLGDFKTFLLDINIRVESLAEYKCEDLRIEITNLDGSPLKESNIEISKFYEFYAEGRKLSTKYHNQCRFYFTGSLREVLEGRKEAVLIRFSGQGLKTKYLEMKLKESYSSFVDVKLHKKKDKVNSTP